MVKRYHYNVYYSSGDTHFGVIQIDTVEPVTSDNIIKSEVASFTGFSVDSITIKDSECFSVDPICKDCLRPLRHDCANCRKNK